MSIKASVVCPPDNVYGRPGKMCKCHSCDSDIFVMDDILDQINKHSEVEVTKENTTFICMTCGLGAMHSAAAQADLSTDVEMEKDKFSESLRDEEDFKFKNKHNE